MKEIITDGCLKGGSNEGRKDGWMHEKIKGKKERMRKTIKDR